MKEIIKRFTPLDCSKMPKKCRSQVKAGYVYYFMIEKNGYVYYKVGITTDIVNRIKTCLSDSLYLSTARIGIIDFVAFASYIEAYSYEGAIHKYYHQYSKAAERIVISGNSEVYCENILGIETMPDKFYTIQDFPYCIKENKRYF